MGDFNSTIPTFTVGKLRASDMVTMANFASAVTGASTSYTPTLTNLTLGNGTMLANYRRLGKWVEPFKFKFTLGSTSAVGTGPQFTLPTGMTPTSFYSVNNDPVCDVLLTQTGVTNARGIGLWNSTNSTIQIFYFNTATTIANVTATAPWTWATGHIISVIGHIEIA